MSGGRTLTPPFQIVVKDGEPMPAWKDISTPEVSGNRAVIPSSAKQAIFYFLVRPRHGEERG